MNPRIVEAKSDRARIRVASRAPQERQNERAREHGAQDGKESRDARTCDHAAILHAALRRANRILPPAWRDSESVLDRTFIAEIRCKRPVEWPVRCVVSSAFAHDVPCVKPVDPGDEEAGAT